MLKGGGTPPHTNTRLCTVGYCLVLNQIFSQVLIYGGTCLHISRTHLRLPLVSSLYASTTSPFPCARAVDGMSTKVPVSRNVSGASSIPGGGSSGGTFDTHLKLTTFKPRPSQVVVSAVFWRSGPPFAAWRLFIPPLTSRAAACNDIVFNNFVRW